MTASRAPSPSASPPKPRPDGRRHLGIMPTRPYPTARVLQFHAPHGTALRAVRIGLRFPWGKPAERRSVGHFPNPSAAAGDAEIPRFRSAALGRTHVVGAPYLDDATVKHKDPQDGPPPHRSRRSPSLAHGRGGRGVRRLRRAPVDAERLRREEAGDEAEGEQQQRVHADGAPILAEHRVAGADHGPVERVGPRDPLDPARH